MRVAYFDAVSGAAGDMILGALLDAGLDFDRLRAELSLLDLGGYSLSRERVTKQHLSATQFLVHLHGHDEHHDHSSGHAGEHGTTLQEILHLIESSRLKPEVQVRAISIFRCLAEAEGRVHGMPAEEVHFHEVGAIDSIVDIVGSAIAFDLLHLDRVYCSSLPLGSGVIATRHGPYPIPAPATAEILASAHAPTRPGVAGTEQVTPTGAAILTTVAEFEQPEMRLRSVGYGSGEADLSIPNVLRVWLGDSDGAPAAERLRMLEANLDDMNPEIQPYVIERCLASGALDALLVPVLMKKGRPGVKIEVLCNPGDEERLRKVLLLETSTLGVRAGWVDRWAVERRHDVVQTAFGPIPVKLKVLDGIVVGAAPEFEACRAAAAEQEVALQAVYAEAQAAARSLVSRKE